MSCQEENAAINLSAPDTFVPAIKWKVLKRGSSCLCLQLLKPCWACSDTRQPVLRPCLSFCPCSSPCHAAISTAGIEQPQERGSRPLERRLGARGVRGNLWRQDRRLGGASPPGLLAQGHPGSRPGAGLAQNLAFSLPGPATLLLLGGRWGQFLSRGTPRGQQVKRFPWASSLHFGSLARGRGSLLQAEFSGARSAQPKGEASESLRGGPYLQPPFHYGKWQTPLEKTKLHVGIISKGLKINKYHYV